MAKLIPQGGGVVEWPIHLRLGTNRVGRGAHNDVSIDHATVSAVHCELILGGESLVVRDLGSTNGTFLDGQQVKQAEIHSGQALRIGSVDFVVEVSEVQVFVPKVEEVAPPKLVSPSGFKVCLHHDDRSAAWQCTRCQNLYCTPCIHRIRRSAGKVLYLCPDCSGVCEVLPEFVKQDKRTWFGFIKDKLDVTKLITKRITRRIDPK